MKKNGKTSPFLMLGILAVIAILIYAVFFMPGGTVPTGDDGKPIVQCDSTTTPNLTINGYDIDNPGTAITEATNLYRIKGQKTWKTFTLGTGFDVSAGQELEIVLGITTTDFTDNAYGEYIPSYTVPCEENPTFEVKMYNDEVETSLTATFYNADGDAGAETFSTGETQTVSVQLKAGTDEYFGNPTLEGNPNVIVLALNSTEWDKPEQVFLSDGTELSEVQVPGRQALSSGLQYYAYELPLIGDKKVEVFMDLNADDTNAPATDMTAYVFAGNYFINGDTAELSSGVETEEDVAVGTDASDTVTLDFTA